MTDSINRLETSNDLTKAFLAYNKVIFAYIMARVQARELAEDITQEVFVKVWQAREKFNAEKGGLKNWLYIIAINTLRSHFRSQKNRPTHELTEELADGSDLVDSLSTEQLHDCILRVMKKLPERDQELLTLYYTQELSLQEVADIMEMNYSAAKVAVHRALKKLKDLCNHFSS